MTTVVDPGTTSETAIFNKGSTALLNVSMTSTPFVVPAVAGRVVINAISPTPGIPYTGPIPAFNLSPDFQIGDEVWITSQMSPVNFQVAFNINDEFSSLLAQTISIGLIKTANGSGTPPNWELLSFIKPGTQVL
jgi:hypothetical protein